MHTITIKVKGEEDYRKIMSDLRKYTRIEVSDFGDVLAETGNRFKRSKLGVDEISEILTNESKLSRTESLSVLKEFDTASNLYSKN